MSETAQSVPAARTKSAGQSVASDVALIACFAAVIAVCAILPAIHVGGLVPITLQTFAVLLAGAVLGAKRRGALAVLLYLAVGAIGLPVFSGGAAGIAPFVGPSAGYLIAFPCAAALCGFLVERLPRKEDLVKCAARISCRLRVEPRIYPYLWAARYFFLWRAQHHTRVCGRSRVLPR